MARRYKLTPKYRDAIMKTADELRVVLTDIDKSEGVDGSKFKDFMMVFLGRAFATGSPPLPQDVEAWKTFGAIGVRALNDAGIHVKEVKEVKDIKDIDPDKLEQAVKQLSGLTKDEREQFLGVKQEKEKKEQGELLEDERKKYIEQLQRGLEKDKTAVEGMQGLYEQQGKQITELGGKASDIGKGFRTPPPLSPALTELKTRHEAILEKISELQKDYTKNVIGWGNYFTDVPSALDAHIQTLASDKHGGRIDLGAISTEVGQVSGATKEAQYTLGWYSYSVEHYNQELSIVEELLEQQKEHNELLTDEMLPSQLPGGISLPTPASRLVAADSTEFENKLNKQKERLLQLASSSPLQFWEALRQRWSQQNESFGKLNAWGKTDEYNQLEPLRLVDEGLLIKQQSFLGQQEQKLKSLKKAATSPSPDQGEIRKLTAELFVLQEQQKYIVGQLYKQRLTEPQVDDQNLFYKEQEELFTEVSTIVEAQLKVALDELKPFPYIKYYLAKALQGVPDCAYGGLVGILPPAKYANAEALAKAIVDAEIPATDLGALIATNDSFANQDFIDALVDTKKYDRGTLVKDLVHKQLAMVIGNEQVRGVKFDCEQLLKVVPYENNVDILAQYMVDAGVSAAEIRALAARDVGFASKEFLKALMEKDTTKDAATPPVDAPRYTMTDLITEGHFTYEQLLYVCGIDKLAVRLAGAPTISPPSSLKSYPNKVSAKTLHEAAIRDFQNGSTESFNSLEIIKVLLGFPVPLAPPTPPSYEPYTLGELIAGGFTKDELAAAYGSEDALVDAINDPKSEVSADILYEGAKHDPAYAEKTFVSKLTAKDEIERLSKGGVLPLIYSGVSRDSLLEIFNNDADVFRQALKSELEKDKQQAIKGMTQEQARAFFECGLTGEDLEGVQGLYPQMIKLGVSLKEFMEAFPAGQALDELQKKLSAEPQITVDLLRNSTVSQDFKDKAGIDLLLSITNTDKSQRFNAADMIRIGCTYDSFKEALQATNIPTPKQIKEQQHLTVVDLQNAHESFRQKEGINYLYAKGEGYSLKDLVRMGCTKGDLENVASIISGGITLAQALHDAKVPASVLHDRGTKPINRGEGVDPQKILADTSYVEGDFINDLVEVGYTHLELIQGGYTVTELTTGMHITKPKLIELLTGAGQLVPGPSGDFPNLMPETVVSLLKAEFSLKELNEALPDGMGIPPAKLKISAIYLHDYEDAGKYPYRDPERIIELMKGLDGLLPAYTLEDLFQGWYSAEELLRARIAAGGALDEYLSLSKLKKHYSATELQRACEAASIPPEQSQTLHAELTGAGFEDLLTADKAILDALKEKPRDIAGARALAKAMYGEVWEDMVEKKIVYTSKLEKIPHFLEFSLPAAKEGLTGGLTGVAFDSKQPIFGQLFSEDGKPKTGITNVAHAEALGKWLKFLESRYERVKGDPEKLKRFKELKLEDLEKLEGESKKRIADGTDIGTTLNRHLRESLREGLDKAKPEEKERLEQELLAAAELGLQQGWERFEGIFREYETKAEGEENKEALHEYYSKLMEAFTAADMEMGVAGDRKEIRARLKGKLDEVSKVSGVSDDQKRLKNAAEGLYDAWLDKRQALDKLGLQPPTFEEFLQQSGPGKGEALTITRQSLEERQKALQSLTKGERVAKTHRTYKDDKFVYDSTKTPPVLTVPPNWWGVNEIIENTFKVLEELGWDKPPGVKMSGGSDRWREAFLEGCLSRGIHVDFDPKKGKEEELKVEFDKLKKLQDTVAKDGIKAAEGPGMLLMTAPDGMSSKDIIEKAKAELKSPGYGDLIPIIKQGEDYYVLTFGENQKLELIDVPVLGTQDVRANAQAAVKELKDKDDMFTEEKADLLTAKALKKEDLDSEAYKYIASVGKYYVISVANHEVLTHLFVVKAKEIVNPPSDIAKKLDLSEQQRGVDILWDKHNRKQQKDILDTLHERYQRDPSDTVNTKMFAMAYVSGMQWTTEKGDHKLLPLINLGADAASKKVCDQYIGELSKTDYKVSGGTSRFNPSTGGAVPERNKPLSKVIEGMSPKDKGELSAASSPQSRAEQKNVPSADLGASARDRLQFKGRV